MERNKEQYWPQHKVFFVATLALFPDKLNGHEVNQWFYQPYFVSQDPNFIELELEEYRKAGYLKYDKPDALYRISEINAEKASADLTKYLKKWQRNELLSLPANKPPAAKNQQTLLISAVARAYHSNPKEPRVTLQDIYGEPDSYAYEPTFWELVLTCQLFDRKISITHMGYDQLIDGLYENNPQPLIDFKIMDKELVSLAAQTPPQLTVVARPTTSANIVAEQTTSKPTTRQAYVFMRERYVSIAISGDDTYSIAKVGDDTSHHKFMLHILKPENNDIDIAISEINGLTDLKAAPSLSQLARYCGFVKPFKRAFFYH